MQLTLSLHRLGDFELHLSSPPDEVRRRLVSRRPKVVWERYKPADEGTYRMAAWDDRPQGRKVILCETGIAQARREDARQVEFRDRKGRCWR